jgi:hypothetical protein
VAEVRGRPTTQIPKLLFCKCHIASSHGFSYDTLNFSLWLWTWLSKVSAGPSSQCLLRPNKIWAQQYREWAASHVWLSDLYSVLNNVESALFCVSWDERSIQNLKWRRWWLSLSCGGLLCICHLDNNHLAWLLGRPCSEVRYRAVLCSKRGPSGFRLATPLLCW